MGRDGAILENGRFLAVFYHNLNLLEEGQNTGLSCSLRQYYRTESTSCLIIEK